MSKYEAKAGPNDDEEEEVIPMDERHLFPQIPSNPPKDKEWTEEDK